MTPAIKIDYLDHVAIRVKDLEVSVNWYQKVLGLKKTKLKEWGEFPIFMLSGRSGVALFPAKLEDEKLDESSKNVGIDHFAFNVDRENFEMAIQTYSDLGLEFEIKDHHYFDSIYTKDPDGHVVELTSIKVNEKEFYKE